MGVVPVTKVVLVEGLSDRYALETLARRRGRDLSAEGVAVVAMDGATNFRKFLEYFGSAGLNVQVSGLVDEGEARVFQRALERAGFGVDLSRADLEALGFYVCVSDLEDELIRALGPAEVERILAAEGDLVSYRTFQKQPAQQGRTEQARLRRFMGTRGGRKRHYATVLVNALDLDRVPEPLDGLLAHLSRSQPAGAWSNRGQ